MLYKTKISKVSRKTGKSVPRQNGLEKFASLGKLVSGIAHELNNPLDGVIRYTNLALESLPEESIACEYLLNAKKGLNRMANIMRSLLDFSSSLSPVFDRSIDVNQAIEESLMMLGHHILSHNIKVVKQFNARLPLVPDKGLKLVFTNIIKNACGVMPKEGILKISTGTRDGFIEIKFTDTGQGVPKEIRDRIFEPFFTTKEMGKGSGLGLAICDDIIQRHKGKIFLEDTQDKGATFTIQLPVNGLSQERTIA